MSMRRFVVHTSICFTILFVGLAVLPFHVDAVREGTSNANIMIRRYERRAQFGKAALWHETAATCIELISKPIAQITLEVCERLGDKARTRQLKAELADMERQRQAHLKKALEDWAHTGEAASADLETERGKIHAFLAEWVAHYPSHFYDFGTYRQLFEPRIDELKREGKFQKALLLEAQAAEMLAREYDEVTLRFFESYRQRIRQATDAPLVQTWDTRAAAYRETRDAHLQRAARLRTLAEQPLDSWPAEADRHENPTPVSEHRLTAEQAIQKASNDPYVRRLLTDYPKARSFAWFQGFAWTVSFYARGWENLAIVFLNDRTGQVTDVLRNPGDLENDQRRETDRDDEPGEDEGDIPTLRFSEHEVLQKAKQVPLIDTFLKTHPDARLNPEYSGQYECWIVEIILGSREVGLVSISDATGAVLEVDIDE